MEILIKKDWTAAEIKKENLKAGEFQANKSTSNVSNVLDMADLGKTVLLCKDHVKQFATPAVLSKYGYRKMTDYPYVIGNCDYCKVNGQAQLFLREDDFNSVWLTKEQQRKDREYAGICQG
jgi:hypothetical protein